ncbi:M61 family metallopeptidase [Olivibacter sitiensis]|uniref:M61 family metallopeptidase n=1 Tax=Olivibacter sitiensis TaxID=376470 RepID=UPI001FDFBABF|nr:PDZ domain-containing protein [Olivibacter sitiensis]
MAQLHNASPVYFELSFSEPQAHYIDVRMTIPGVKKESVELTMPVWAPGSYLIREFSKNVEAFEAFGSAGQSLKTTKTAKNKWQVIAGGEENITVTYRVYAFEVSVRTSFVDASHAFISPTGVFMFVDDMIDRPSEVKVIPFAGWKKVSTGLELVSGKTDAYYAENFDILFDSPIEIGNQDVFTFDAAGVHHEVAMVGGGNYDKMRLQKDMAKIVEGATQIFDENPNKRYVFIVHHYANGGGGLEHLNSTVLGASRFAYETENGYKGFLGLVAHEYFHLWNIKRLRPAALGPFDYSAENYTTNLWIGEGFTAYYDNLLVHRAGFSSQEQYFQDILGDIQAVENRAGNHVQPLGEASFDAWIKYYRQDENSVNTGVSYYNKGALMALLIDLKLLHENNGAIGLDEVMHAAYREFYKREGRGYNDEEFKTLAEKVGGISLDDIYDLVNTASSPDYNSYLAYAGLELIDLNEGKVTADLGIRTKIVDGEIIVSSVSRASTAWDGGINVNDELIAINGYRLDVAGRELARVTAAASVGDEWKVLLSRDGIVQELNIKMKPSTAKAFQLVEKDQLNPKQLLVRNRWLRQF